MFSLLNLNHLPESSRGFYERMMKTKEKNPPVRPVIYPALAFPCSSTGIMMKWCNLLSPYQFTLKTALSSSSKQWNVILSSNTHHITGKYVFGNNISFNLCMCAFQNNYNSSFPVQEGIKTMCSEFLKEDPCLKILGKDQLQFRDILFGLDRRAEVLFSVTSIL